MSLRWVNYGTFAGENIRRTYFQTELRKKNCCKQIYRLITNKHNSLLKLDGQIQIHVVVFCKTHIVLVQIQDKVACLTNKFYMKSKRQLKPPRRKHLIYIHRKKRVKCSQPHIIILAWELVTQITMGPYFY